MATTKSKGGAVVPAKGPSLPMDLEAQMNADAQSTAKLQVSAGGDMVSTQKDRTFKLPDGTISVAPIDVIMVDHVYFNADYPGAFDPKNPQPPTCAALAVMESELVPFKESPNRQAESCAACPLNAFGSSGSSGKACKNNILIAVLPPDFDAETPLMVMKVSPTALRYFHSYIKTAARVLSRPPYALITEVDISISNDATKHQSLRFGNARVLSNDRVAMVMERREEARARLLTPPTFTPRDAAKPVKKAVARRAA